MKRYKSTSKKNYYGLFTEGVYCIEAESSRVDSARSRRNTRSL